MIAAKREQFTDLKLNSMRLTDRKYPRTVIYPAHSLFLRDLISILRFKQCVDGFNYPGGELGRMLVCRAEFGLQ